MNEQMPKPPKSALGWETPPSSTFIRDVTTGQPVELGTEGYWDVNANTPVMGGWQKSIDLQKAHEAQTQTL